MSSIEIVSIFFFTKDGGGIWKDFGKPTAREMTEVTPEYLEGTKAGKAFPGSMGPKIQAAIDFVKNSKNPNAWAAIGDLKDTEKIVKGEEGTLVKMVVKDGVQWREGRSGPPRKETKDPPPF